MRGFVINLFDRPERWQSAQAQSHRLGIQIIRVDAIGPIQDSVYLTPGVAAIWESHKRAFLEFLLSHQTHALILEDDFKVKRFAKKRIEKALKISSFDFLQIGFLKTRKKEYIDIFYANNSDLLLKIFFKLSARFKNIFGNLNQKYRVLKQSEIPVQIVLDDIRPGAHAYIISKKFAQEMLKINTPAFLSTDQLYISLGQMRIFSMGRLRKSLISQSNSPSSVRQRFVR